MAFWGKVIRGSDSYIHYGHARNGRLRITQATLGRPINSKDQSTNEKAVVFVKKGISTVRLCVLISEKIETQSLELELEWNDEVVISVTGNHSVSLSGYFTGSHGHFKSTDGNLDIPGEDIAETESKESSGADSDDYDFSDSFINDNELEKLCPSPKPNRKTRGEFSVQLTPKFPDFKKKKQLKNKYRVEKSSKPSPTKKSSGK